MGYEAIIKATASQPISNFVGFSLSSDDKKYQAHLNLHKSVEEYQERMAKFRLKLAKQIREENTTTAEKRFRDNIQRRNLFETDDPFALRQGQSEIESLLRFIYFNNTNPLDLSGIKAQQAAVEARLASLKKGLEPEDNTTNKGSPTLYNGAFQNPGERDILS